MIRLTAIFLVFASAAFSQDFNEMSVSACMEADQTSGAACVLPLRQACAKTAETEGLSGEIACLDRATREMIGWTQGLLSSGDAEAAKVLDVQAADYLAHLTSFCDAQRAGDSQADRRRYAICQMAGTAALYRNVIRVQAGGN